MARDGVANVTVERLCRDLGVTKGSFYWHFANRSALLDAMVDEWRVRSSGLTGQLIRRMPGRPLEQLSAIMKLPESTPDAADGAQVEMALRLWAMRNEHVGELLHELQQQRLEAFESVLRQCGVQPKHLQGLTMVFASVMFRLWVTDNRVPADREVLRKAMLSLVQIYSPDARAVSRAETRSSGRLGLANQQESPSSGT